MPASLEVKGETGIIILTGKFDFSVQDNFRQAIDDTLNIKTIKEIQVDMADVTFMDSSAIGLLLLLNQKAAAGGKSLTLINCYGSIREILAIGGFDSVLTIH